METKKYTSSEGKNKNVIKAFMFRYLPYWPLFILLVAICGAAAYAYLHITAPVYEASATLLIKDDKKGADASKILEALNIYSADKIVENETEVIQSKDLIREAVDSLQLYASFFEDGQLISRDAYTTSPITITLQNPERVQDTDRIDFAFSKKNQSVTINGKSYSLNKWVLTPFGIAKFNRNPNQKAQPLQPLYFSLSSLEEVTGRISPNLTVTSPGKLSSVITLKLRDKVPERGVNILNALIQAYNRASVTDKNVMATNTLAFVEERIKQVSKELDSIEGNLQTLRARKGIVDLSEQGKLYLQNVGENDREMTDLNMQLAMLNEVERYVQSKDGKIGIVPSIAGIKDPLTAGLLQKFYDSQIEYERLKKTIPTGNPTMYSLKNEIDNMRPTILENIQNQRLSLQASRNNLSTKTGSYASMLNTIPQKEKELLAISRQQAIKNNAYSFLVQKREETAFAYAAAVPDSRTVEQPNASTAPVSPNRNIVFEVALALALLIGVAIVNAKEFLTSKVLFRSDIENLTTIPIVAEIVKVKGKQPLIINNNPKPLTFIEQFRQLRAALGLYSRQQQHKKILVTSSIAAEGKSFVSNNLALSLAMSGKKVLLLDFDLRKPKTTTWHNLAEDKGLVSFLEDANQPINELIYQTTHPKLYIIPAGVAQGTQSNPTELLINGDLKKLFTYIESKFDFIIVDTSPVDPVTDAYVLAEYCDATLFVIRHAYTPKKMVEVLNEGYKNMALKNINIVFNGIKARGFFSKRYGYEYGFGRATVYGDKTYQVQHIIKSKI